MMSEYQKEKQIWRAGHSILFTVGVWSLCMSTVPAIHECEHNFFPSTGTNAQYLPLIDAVLGYTELILYLSEPE